MNKPAFRSGPGLVWCSFRGKGLAELGICEKRDVCEGHERVMCRGLWRTLNPNAPRPRKPGKTPRRPTLFNYSPSHRFATQHRIVQAPCTAEESATHRLSYTSFQSAATYPRNNYPQQSAILRCCTKAVSDLSFVVNGLTSLV